MGLPRVVQSWAERCGFIMRARRWIVVALTLRVFVTG
jgi:hypothetical protein